MFYSPKEMQCVVFCHCHLPAFINVVPILCLEQYYSNVLLKKSLTSSRKTESLKDNKVHVCVSMWRFLGSFSGYCFISDHTNIIFPSSKQTALKWCPPWHHEPLKSCQEQTTEKKRCMSCLRELRQWCATTLVINWNPYGPSHVSMRKMWVILVGSIEWPLAV